MESRIYQDLSLLDLYGLFCDRGSDFRTSTRFVTVLTATPRLLQMYSGAPHIRTEYGCVSHPTAHDDVMFREGLFARCQPPRIR